MKTNECEMKNTNKHAKKSVAYTQRLSDCIFKLVKYSAQDLSCFLPSKLSLVFCSVLVFAFCSVNVNVVLANGMSVENVSLVDLDEDNDTIDVEFDMSWSNSWNDSVNHDAAWVFMKFQTGSGGDWAHATLKTAGTNPSDFDQGTKQSGSIYSSLDAKVGADKKGVFVYGGHKATGDLDFHDIQLRWDYAADGVSDSDADNASTTVKVFAIEMVYVPEGGFNLGDSADGALAADANFEYGGDSGSDGTIPSEEKLSFGTATTQWYYNSAGNSGEASDGDAFELSEAFPKGFQATYVMKYEMSQGQYRDFLNTLTQAQQSTRVASDLTNENDQNTYVMVTEGQATVVSRQTIKAGTNPSDGDPYTFSCDLDDNNTGDQSSDGAWIAMNYLSWMDLAAYADWAALRPMTEIEFERFARGPIEPVANEYVWGSTTLTDADTISNSGANNEGVTETGTGLCNTNNDGVSGPLRVGFAATGSTSTRLETAAGYYGIFDLSGNVWERTVTVGNADGRGFSGTHGDGVLNATGNATNPDWPGFDGDDVTGADGSGFRGGSWAVASGDVKQNRTSNRALAANSDSTRTNDDGARLVRTANA